MPLDNYQENELLEFLALKKVKRVDGWVDSTVLQKESAQEKIEAGDTVICLLDQEWVDFVKHQCRVGVDIDNQIGEKVIVQRLCRSTNDLECIAPVPDNFVHWFWPLRSCKLIKKGNAT